MVIDKASTDIGNASEHLGLVGFCSHQHGLKGGQGGLIICYANSLSFISSISSNSSASLIIGSMSTPK
jgi:hypothetical protein